MKRNKLFNRNSLIIFTIMFTLFSFMATDMFAAKKVKLFKNNSKSFISQLNQKDFDVLSLGTAFGFQQDEGFKLKTTRKDFNNVSHTRYQQTYKGIPIWGMQTVVSVDKDKKIVGLNGEMTREIHGDVGNLLSSPNPRGALENAKALHMTSDNNAHWTFSNEKSGTYIYVAKNGKAHLAYVVSFFADTEKGNPSRPLYVVDAKTGKILENRDILTYADGQGPGGNLKIGQYYYGGATPDYPAFGVTQSSTTCTMDTADVRTINMNHTTNATASYSFTCPENLVKEINGAYSPLNDAQFMGQVVYDMFQNWYSTPVLPFQLTMRVHYSTNYENAFWNGSSMTFGDGYSTFYPLVCLDVAAHEVCHGFTENQSDLNYSGESGGINESYSDMAGEAAEYYMRGSNDFLLGYDIFKAAGQALRYMADPTLDGRSIDHINDYYTGLDVHYSSGLYNKVFWALATTAGWDTHKAFDVFTKANMDYWSPSTTFQQGAEGAMSAAIDYGYNCQDVVNAFAVVGITIVCPGGNQAPAADFNFSANGLTVDFTDASTDADGTIVSWLWNFGDTTSSTSQNPSHTYAADGTYSVTLTVTDNDGATDFITKNVTVNSGGLLEMYVYDITQTIIRSGRNYKSSAVVTIRDTQNNPVANATVSVSWSGVVSGSATAVTNSSGQASFISTRVKSTGPFTIAVANVTGTLLYNSSLNIETTDSQSY